MMYFKETDISGKIRSNVILYIQPPFYSN